MNQPALGGVVFAWDASALHHAIDADRLDVLLGCARDSSARTCEHVTTAAVVQELTGNGLAAPVGLNVVHVDNLNEILALASWTTRLSSTQHNRGEATVCAWAEVHGAVVIMDDAKARRVAQRTGLKVHGTLWLIARAVQAGAMPECGASNLVDQLMAVGARYPHPPGGFVTWAKGMGLLS